MSKNKRLVFRKEKFLNDPFIALIDDVFKAWADLVDGRQATFVSDTSHWGVVSYPTYDSCTLEVRKDWCEEVII